jgi:hypothetical protein
MSSSAPIQTCLATPSFAKVSLHCPALKSLLFCRAKVLARCTASAQYRYPAQLKYWELIADHLTKAGWSWGCSSHVDSTGRVLSQQTRTATTESGSWSAQTKN